MSELTKILLTSFFTISGGILLYIITRSFIDHIFQQRKTIGEIIYIPDSSLKEIKKKEIAFNFNKIATDLIVNINVLPFYSLLEYCKIVYNKNAVIDSVKKLNKLEKLFKEREIDWVDFFVNLDSLSKILTFDYNLIRNYYLDSLDGKESMES